MTLAIDGWGAFIQASVDDVVFTVIGEVLKISGPNMEFQAIDATHMGSGLAWKEFIPGLRDGGEVVLELNYTRPTETFILSLLGQTIYWELFWPDAHGWNFSGIITKWGAEDPHDDKITRSVTIKLTGIPSMF